MRYLQFALLPLLVVACSDQEPVAPDTSPLFAMQGMNETPIAGTIALVLPNLPPGRILQTPGGMCHYFDWPIRSEYTGSLQGLVTVTEQCHFQCGDFSTLVCSGPIEGEVIWTDAPGGPISGTISGQLTTNCKPADGCDGVTNLFGSGDLEGVRFKYTWGPSWSPYSYTGTAFSK